MENNTEKRKLNKTEKVVVVFSCLIILLVIIGVTYSFFTAQIIGNETASKTEVSTGLLDIDFDGSEYFNNPAMLLIKDSNKETEAESINFSVGHTNDSTVAASYFVFLTNITITENFKSADLKWELLKDGALLSSGNFLNIEDKSEIMLNSSAISLPVGEVDNLTLRVWLSETDSDQSYLFNGEFRAKVSVQVRAE